MERAFFSKTWTQTNRFSRHNIIQLVVRWIWGPPPEASLERRRKRFEAEIEKKIHSRRQRSSRARFNKSKLSSSRSLIHAIHLSQFYAHDWTAVLIMYRLRRRITPSLIACFIQPASNELGGGLRYIYVYKIFVLVKEMRLREGYGTHRYRGRSSWPKYKIGGVVHRKGIGQTDFHN